MTAKNKADIQSEIDTLLADNTTGDISAEDIRTSLETAKDSYINALETANQTLMSKLNSATISSETTRTGVIDYADLATQSVPISVTGGSGFVPITNDGLGAGTNKSGKVSGVGELWDASSGLFTFNDGLSIHDSVIIRLNITVTTASQNEVVSVKLAAAIGGSPYDISWSSHYYKTSGEQKPLVVTSLVYMGDLNTLNNGARFEIESDGNATVKVNGWAILHNVRN